MPFSPCLPPFSTHYRIKPRTTWLPSRFIRFEGCYQRRYVYEQDPHFSPKEVNFLNVTRSSSFINLLESDVIWKMYEDIIIIMDPLLMIVVRVLVYVSCPILLTIVSPWLEADSATLFAVCCESISISFTYSYGVYLNFASVNMVPRKPVA